MGVTESPVKLLDYFKSIGYVLLIILGLIIMNTKNVKFTKFIIGTLGLIMCLEALSSLFVIDLIGLGISIYIVWWIYNLYETLDGLI